MIKKLIAAITLSSVLLVGCAGNSAADEKDTKYSIESESSEIVESEENEVIDEPTWPLKITFVTTIDSADVIFNNRDDELNNNVDFISVLADATIDAIEKKDEYIDPYGLERLVQPEIIQTEGANELEMLGFSAPDVDEVMISVLSQKSEYGQSVKDKLSQKTTNQDGKEYAEYQSAKIVFENENYFVLAMTNAFINEDFTENHYITDLFTSDELLAVYEKHLN